MRMLEGKVALVTGASRGIGRAVAERFALEGANLVLNYYERADAAANAPDAIGETLRLVRSHQVDAMPYAADVSGRRAVGAMVTAAIERFAAIDILVNNAGIGMAADTVSMEEAAWDRILAVNLKGQFLVTQAVAGQMIERGSGRIINISSELALTGSARLAAYCGSKAGVIGLTKALARELAPHGVLVNCVAPGPTDTDMLPAEERALEAVRAIPLGKIGAPEEIAGAVMYFASPDASWTTGQVLSPNGGTVI